MLLVIDVGNTNIVYGLFEGSELRHEFRVESNRGRTADEYAVTLRQLLAMRELGASSIEAAIVASVVPSLTEPMVGVVTRAFACPVLVVGPGIKTGLNIRMDDPSSVGRTQV